MNNKEKLKVDREVVTMNTGVIKVVKTPTKTSTQAEKTLEEHLTDNKKNTKVTIDWKNVSFYILIIGCVTILVLSLVHFYDKYNEEYEKKRTTTTTMAPIKTTTTTTKIKYQTTTTAPTQATHTVFDKKKWE